jgi:cytochrome c oxidase subunit 2
MDARVTVLPPEEYDAWLAKVSNIADLPPEERGLKVFRGAGCSACHNFDGLASTGPALNGIFGTQRTMADGSTVTVDENYLRESILNPNAKISAGFAPDLMPPSFAKSLNDQKVDWLIELIKLKGAQ